MPILDDPLAVVLPSALARALELAPPSLLLGLTDRDERLRERSRYALAEALADALESPAPADPDQLVLL